MVAAMRPRHLFPTPGSPAGIAGTVQGPRTWARSLEYGSAVPLHPAENRGYRELYVSARAAQKRLGRLAQAIDGTDAREPVDKAAESLGKLLEELGPLTARHDLHGNLTAQAAARTSASCGAPCSIAS